MRTRVLNDIPTYVWLTLVVVLAFLVSRPQELTPAERVDRASEWAPSLLAASAAIALMVMALIESVKRAFRSRFHARELRRWLNWTPPAPIMGQKSPTAGKAKMPRSEPAEQLLRLLAPRYTDAILSLPSEQLCAQIGGTLEIVLSYPRRYRDLLCGLAGPAGRRDVMRYVRSVDRFNRVRSRAEPAPRELEARETRLIDARNAVSHRIQRHLDAFQVHVSVAWGALLRLTATALGILLAATGATFFGAWRIKDFVATGVVVVLVGLIGGVLSSSARDVLAMVERVRR